MPPYSTLFASLTGLWTLQTLREQPRPVDVYALAALMGKRPNELGPTLGRLRARGWIDRVPGPKAPGTNRPPRLLHAIIPAGVKAADRTLRAMQPACLALADATPQRDGSMTR